MENSISNLENIIDNLKLDYEKILYSGINSKVYLLKDNEEKYALKIFSSLNKDSRLRIQREVNAIKLLKSNSIKNIPKLYGFNYSNLYILTKFLNGKKIELFSPQYISQIIAFSLNLKRQNLIIEDSKIVDASDNFLQIKRFLLTMEDKFKFLKESNKFANLYQDSQEKFIEFLYSEFIKYRNFILNGSYFKNYLIKKNQIFSQSDVGIHNCLDNMGKLFFFDFEHSGWDDPAKLLADWILRPNNNIEESEMIELVNSFCSKWHDRQLINRLKILMPLINLKWILIRISIGFSGKVENHSHFLNSEINNNLYKEGRLKINFITENLNSSIFP